MNYLKSNTKGIDTIIKGLQSYLYDSITSYWDLNNFDGYGRVYKNKRNEKVVPEYYKSNREYKEVLLSDKKDGIMFFVASDTTEVNGNSLIQNCDILFTINLNKIGLNNERQDEEFRQKIIYFLNNYPRRQEITQIHTGLSNVYLDFNGVQEYFYDMQDFHHFKTTLNIRFSNNC